MAFKYMRLRFLAFIRNARHWSRDHFLGLSLEGFFFGLGLKDCGTDLGLSLEVCGVDVGFALPQNP